MTRLPDSETAAARIAFLRGLRAVRQLRPDPLPEAVLHDIVEVARWSGSAGNRQPWEFVVVRDRGMLARLATIDGANAGHLATTRYSGRPAPPREWPTRWMAFGAEQEQALAGFWPGNERLPEPALVAYTSGRRWPTGIGWPSNGRPDQVSAFTPENVAMTDYGSRLEFGLSITPQIAEIETFTRLTQVADTSGLELVAIQDHAYNNTVSTLGPRLRSWRRKRNASICGPAASALHGVAGCAIELGLVQRLS